MAKMTLPAGFKAITSMGDNWGGQKPGDTVTGKLVKIETVHFDAKGKKGTPGYRGAQDVPKYFIQTKTGTVGVLESAGLRALNQVKKGQTVSIAYVGKKKMGKGKNPMREYLIGVK